MAIEVFNRYEKKFLIDEATYTKLTRQLSDYMEADQFSKDREFYNISNIYYDTPTNDLIRNSIEKPVYKEKLRLRSYGVPDLEDEVFLEIKKKYRGMVNKRRTAITLKDAYDYVETKVLSNPKPDSNKQIIREIDFFLNRYQIEPKLYLSYDRRAYFVSYDSDFRITFDTNIKTRRYDLRLENGSYGEDLLEKGGWLMEVKIMKAAPLWFTKILSDCKVYGTSFSKYGTEYKRMVQSKIEKGEWELCLNPYYQQQQKQHYQLVHQY